MALIRSFDIIAPEDMEYSIDLSRGKEYEKFISRTEKVIRQSKEYRDYIAYLKEYVDMNHCAFFSGIRNGENGRVRIEIHHEPFTLYDIVETVMLKQMADGMPLNDLYIADEVMNLHYKNQVGLIPLSKSVHEIVHDGQIFVPIQLVYGDYRQFVDDYADYNERILDKLEKKIALTSKIKQEMIDKLETHYVYINVDGYELPAKIEIAESLRQTA